MTEIVAGISTGIVISGIKNISLRNVGRSSVAVENYLMLSVQLCRSVIHSVTRLIGGICKVIQISEVSAKSVLCGQIAVSQITHGASVPISDNELCGLVYLSQLLNIIGIVGRKRLAVAVMDFLVKSSSADLCVIALLVVVELYSTRACICSKITCRRGQRNRLCELLIAVIVGNAVLGNSICSSA